MKQYTSIMALAVRALLGKVLAVTAATAAIQLAVFRLIPEQVSSLYNLQRESWTAPLAALGLTAVLVLLALHGGPLSGVRTSYTLRRLPVSEQTVTILWTVVYLGFLLLFWAAEVGVVLLQQHWTALLYPSQVPAFQRFSDNYSTPFFHGLLPLYEWPRYLCNAIWLIALAWNAAAFSYQHRRGRLPGGGILVLILGLLFFVMGETTSGMVVSILFTFVMVMVTLWSFFSLREEEEGDA